MTASTVTSPFALAKTFVFRRYLTVRQRLIHLRQSARTVREARRRRRHERHNERMLSFYSWCEACRAFGSIF